MKPEEFCYWLQGFFELTDSKNLSEKQIVMIKEHLKLVFNKVTPTSVGTPSLPEPELTKEMIDKALEKGKERASKVTRHPMIPGRGTRYC